MNQIGQLPEWIDFEMEQQEPQFDLTPLTGALKQRRLRNAPTGGVGTSLGNALGPQVEMPKMANMGGNSGKGMKSL